jgi:hypothetical protein
LDQKRLEALLQESLTVATSAEAMKQTNFSRLAIDTVSESKAVEFPTDVNVLPGPLRCLRPGHFRDTRFRS